MKTLIFCLILLSFFSTEEIQAKDPIISPCGVSCKKSTLEKLGFNTLFSNALIDSCKKNAKDPVHCIKIGASIAGAESSKGWKCHKKNCVGLGGRSYSTYREGVDDWVKSYNKHWYKRSGMDSFYSRSGTLPVTRYCTSEVSSNSRVGCPNGLKHSTAVFNSIKF